ncbi:MULTISPECIES: helix-turn-helix transcriptional regulator [Paenibacillus]|uniref:AraC family transcriptional regulator n=1 Tax=Paenibacillus campinasensis TaxID=66347 RepID=A0A268EW44_9BACL|nr:MULTISPECIES: AraC family transcriptional regulator [Paenibacillus]MUG68471.1 helix-turn-helix domain-containing protein [Paenibacillus campinasensis]PAD77340.1 AraC family transcriptional regulator [Paenibacillus campinasensis]PAK50319.1 AraC family transcriptional regulator [Paenibacillus sp. 7541]
MADHSLLTFSPLPLPFYIESGRSFYAPGDSHPSRRNLGVYDLIMVDKGCLYLGEEGQQWALGPGDMVILLPDAYHYSVQGCLEESSFYWLHFQCHEPDASREDSPMAHSIQLPKQGRMPDPEQAFRLLEALQLLTVEPRSTAFWREQTLFIELMQLLDRSRIDQEQTRVHKVAEQIEAYIKRHYREPISNARLSEALHYHYNYLTRCMKTAYGITPAEFLLQYRLDQAKRLLLTTPWSISRIAEHVGFQYPPYFTRRFSARFGISPLKFRKQYTE